MGSIIDLSDKKIVVTGASSGIGRATCILLSQLGAHVMMVGRREDELENTLQQMDGEGHRYFPYDLTDLEHIEDLIRDIVSYDGDKLDGLVHCAGISRRLPIRNLNYSNMDPIMRINFYAFIELAKAYAHKNCNGGSIVGISSYASINGGTGQTIYAASKAALDAAVIVLSKELVRKNIRINSIRPGYVNTAMYENAMKKTGSDELGNQQLLGVGEPEDIANMIAYLLSDAAKFITGSNYVINGGSC